MPSRMTEAEALQELGELVAATKYPCLDSAVLQRLLKKAAIYSPWEAETDVETGDQVVPTVWNGRMYRCLTPGTTGTTEPTWPRGARVSALRPGLLGTIVADDSGTDAAPSWEDVGPAPAQAWDLDAAANAGWLKKAALVASDFDFKDAGQTLTRSQVYDHCVSQANAFTPAFVI